MSRVPSYLIIAACVIGSLAITLGWNARERIDFHPDPPQVERCASDLHAVLPANTLDEWAQTCREGFASGEMDPANW